MGSDDKMTEQENRRQRRAKSVCKICGAPAMYSYVGAVVCPSCKMFFKRNAKGKQVRGRVASADVDHDVCKNFRMA